MPNTSSSSLMPHPSPINALWVIHSMAGGGAERAVATVLAHLDRRRIQPALCLFREEGVFLDEVRAHTPIINLNVNGRSDPRLIPRLARVLRQVQPNVTVAFLRGCGLVTAAAHALARRPGRLVISERNTPSQEMQLYGRYPLKRALFSQLYRHVDHILTISPAIRSDLIANFNVPHAQITVIPNPVGDVIRLAMQEPPHPWLAGDNATVVSVGRLHPQKGHDLLLRAFAQLLSQLPHARLIIVGEGEERPLLEQEAARLNITAYVHFAGFQANPYPYIRHATLFALASRYEGFGIVLAEALALGTPVVAADCPGGPRYVLANGDAGLLVPPENVAALSQALYRALTDETLRQRLISAGHAQAQRYAAPVVAAQYATFLESVAGNQMSKQ